VKRRIPRWRDLSPLLTMKKFEISPTTRRLARAVTVEDLRLAARARTPRAVFDYTDGGAGEELSMARARTAFSRVEFLPSVLRDVSVVDPSTDIVGRRAELPLVLGPTGFTRMMHYLGEPAVARAAERAGLPYVLSTMGTTPPERLAEEVPNVRRWFQLYLWRDRAASADFVQRAKATGCDTLMLTVDTPVGGPRLRDQRNGMTIPPQLTMRTFFDGARHPHWWFNFLFTEPLEFASLKHFNGTVAELSNIVFDPTASFADIDWLRTQWDGKLVIKGVQLPDDAARAVAAGADAVVISNHGGRQLDRSPTPLEQLESVLETVGDRAEVYMDGGVRSGSDIAAAVGLGAQGVMIGRAYLYGLMAGGEKGVDRVLEIMRAEFINSMQLIGVSTVDELRKQRARLRPPGV
jgi:L-lactate dehydrogenase (cytochrome)